eukprot:m51a1_g8346 hypothetical protein (511) ;mRNA; f:36084-37616
MEVGARVVSRKDGALGTVRYVGAVEGEAAGGTWAGVEWDDPARGRHDGTLRSRAYFACAPGRSASFARPDALGPARSLLDALRLRYGPAGGAGDAGDEMCVYTAQQRRVPVTLVGAERQRVSIGSLRVADVSALGVERADDEGLGAECASLEELVAADNALWQWSQALRPAWALPSLTSLDLSGNALLGAAAPPEGLAPMPRLRSLGLSRCGVAWQTVVAVACAAPALEALHACANGIRELPAAPAGALGSLRTLGHESNGLASWEAVCDALARLPRLATLSLSGNAIRELRAPREGEWPALAELRVADNAIASWASVDALNGLPALRSLKLSGNPVAAQLPQRAARCHVIARVASLASLNGSAVTARERSEAEMYYVRTHAAAAGPHPRLAELRAKHGMADEPAAAPAASGPAGFVGVTLVCNAASGRSCGEAVEKRVPATMAVGDVRRLCERLFGVEAARQALFFVEEAEGSVGAWPQPMDDDAKELRHYVVGSGGKIVVEDKRPDAQ